MNADIFFADVTEATIDQANQLLGWLAANLTSTNWLEVLDGAELGSSERELAERAVKMRLTETDRPQPLGAVLGGTGLAKERAGLSGEDSQRAIRLLKKSGRLMQIGKGRGRALVIVHADPLSAEDFTAQVAAAAAVAKPNPPERTMIPVDDVPALLKAARDGYRALQAQLAETSDEQALLHSQQRTAELEAEVIEQRSIIDDLKEQIVGLQRSNAMTHQWS